MSSESEDADEQWAGVAAGTGNSEKIYYYDGEIIGGVGKDGKPLSEYEKKQRARQ